MKRTKRILNKSRECGGKKTDGSLFMTVYILPMQDPCYEVRDKFTKKLHKAEDLLKLPLEYLGIFALAAPEPVKERRNEVN